ncbi:MAG: HupE/UreJ family protein [Antarcticimicrobium sp.]|uniref:HupE/UreJ family protein n=1 Tax=Antarcticimicrobium sp. TaxID=2824147 RepID=UPI00263615FA|nr:HupE/UreJ family protein [Antarcticimicrobium sp.]MDF1715733.1 HupE/UreJ family protein [Antarcticimicrobium sp.]
MYNPFRACAINLIAALLLSSLCALFAAGAARGHEVTPTIADLEVTGGVLTLDIRLNAEAFVAGINLDGLINTNASSGSARYDSLRALPPEEFAPRLRAFAETWAGQIRVTANGPVPLAVEAVRVPEVGDAELPRASHLVLTGRVPAGSDTLTLAWPFGSGGLVLRQQGVEDPFTGYIAGGIQSPPIPLQGGAIQTGWQAFADYVPVGFDHILPKGLDHILFVLGLFFLSTQWRPLLWQVSAFTLAHTVTLALGALGWVSLPGSIVEPLIAASIVYVAVEDIVSGRLSRWRPLVIFGFGLLHGLGFASVLGEFGLPEAQFVPALLGFNIGVEIGQLTVIALAFLTVGLWFARKSWYRARIAVPASAVIAVIGSYWFVERVFL